MRLADFILANREPILAEWEAFARSCAPAGGTMDIAALRDHANEMLTAIAAELATPQSRLPQSERSKGRARAAVPAAATAAGAHGAGRAESGFTVAQMVAEYRALRASVILQWTKTRGELGSRDVVDLTRFNEAIDQSLAESITRFEENVQQAKETFLAILGHDLRTPLGAIGTSAAFMVETGELEEPHRTLLARIATSAKRSMTMVGDLLDFTRSRLGGGIPIVRAEMNLGKLVHDLVDEISAAHPQCSIQVDTRGEQRGEWDAARIGQALGNLLGNAVQHGGHGTPVIVKVSGDAEEVAVDILNGGVPISPEQLDGIFNPMKTQRSPQLASRRGPTGSLGLGLYIAERIVCAHDGRIEVESSEAGGTRFTVHLPRRAEPTAGEPGGDGESC